MSIGATDRFNYGDLLFPLVLDTTAATLGAPSFTHAAPTAADLRWAGGVATVALAPTWRSGAPNGAVIAGGEVLGASWGQAWITLMRWPRDRVAAAARRLVGRSRFDACARWVLGGDWPTPYVPSVQAASATRVSANAIGAASLASLDRGTRNLVARALDRCSYLAVRDAAGQAALRVHGIAAELAPDSVAAIRDQWQFAPDEALGECVVFQCSADWLRRHGAGTVEALAALAAKWRSIHLLAIGRAGWHNDDLAVRRLSAELTRRGVPHTIGREKNLKEIAATIAGAGIFIGSSLHGAITATAYAVPSVALAGVTKLSAYLDTWGGGLVPFEVSPADLGSVVPVALAKSKEAREEHAAELARLARRSTVRAVEAVLV